MVLSSSSGSSTPTYSNYSDDDDNDTVRTHSANTQSAADQMKSYHSDVENAESRISIAESNLTDSSLSDSASDSSSVSDVSQTRTPASLRNQGEVTRDVTPKKLITPPAPTPPSATSQKAPQPAQGTVKSAPTSGSKKEASIKRGTTPYGHLMTKNGYYMVGKLTNSHRSRNLSKTSSARPEKVDPITARILSANRAKRQIAGNQAGEIKRKNMQLYEEIKSLRILCRNQEKSLKQFESTQSALPRVLQNFEHDKNILKERLRKTKDSEKRLEREKKRLDMEQEKSQKKIKELNNIIQNKNLDERWSLQQQLSAAENRANEAESALKELDRKMDLQQAALERQLKKEIRRRVRAENESQRNKDDIRLIQEKLTEKEKQLNYTNIYIQRQNKGKRQNRNTSLALPAPELDSSTISAPVIGRQTPQKQKLMIETSLPDQLAAGEGIVVTTTTTKEQTPIIQTQTTTTTEHNIPLTEKPSSTFLTDLTHEHNNDDANHNHPADLNDFSSLIPDQRTVPMASSRAEPRLPSPVDQSSPTPSPPAPVKEESPKKTADALLDEMLFGGANVDDDEDVKETPSPDLFGLDEKPSKQRQDSVPEFDFVSEATTRKTSKDTILAELADLHGNNSPDQQPIKKKSSKTDFNIFDQPRSKPTIDPLEVPKEDELDALLQLNTTSSNNSKQQQQLQKKKSNPIVYNFSEPIENLHLGLSSSGKDFSRTTTTTAPLPAKKENIIDNLFGGGN